MSGEKKRRRRRHGPILIEENTIIDSKSIRTSTTTKEEKHTENTIRKWYDSDDDDETIQDEIQSEKISKKIEHVLRKINEWTNERSSIPIDIQQESVHNTSFNKTNLPTYDNIHHRRWYESPSLNSFRQRCSSSTRTDSSSIISTDRPYSAMTFTNSLLPQMTTTSCAVNNGNNNYFYEGQNRKVRRRI